MAGDNHLAQSPGILLEVDVNHLGVAKGKLHAALGFLLVADVVEGDSVRATHTHTLNGIASIGIGYGVVAGSRRLVDRSDSYANQILVSCNNFSGDTRSCNLSHDSCCEKAQKQCHEKMQSFQHSIKKINLKLTWVAPSFTFRWQI